MIRHNYYAAIASVIGNRTSRGATPQCLIEWLESLKPKYQHNCGALDFINQLQEGLQKES